MSGIGSGQGLNRLFNGSVGTQVNRMLDKLGLPDQLGDLIGARIDAQRGDIAGMMRNLQDLNSGMSTAQLDSVFGKGLPPSGFVPRPFAMLGGLGALGGLGGGLGGILNGNTGIGGGILARGGGFNPFGGISREAPFGKGMVGRSMERQIRNNPFFKAQMERALGGRILPDGRNDGKLTIYRPPFPMLGGLMRAGFQNNMLPKMGMAASIGALALPFAGGLAANAVTGGLMRGLQRMEGNISSFMGGITGQTGINDTTSSNAERANLRNDPEAAEMAKGMGIDVRNASFEDILFIMMMKYAQKKEKEVMGKVKALDSSMKAADDAKAKGQDQGGGGGGKGGGKGGILGGVGSLVGGLVGGPVGGAIGKVGGGFLDGLMGTGGAQQSGDAGGAQGLGGDQGVQAANNETIDGKKIGDMSETMKQQMLTKLMNDLSKMYEMLSNMIKSMHDMQMNPIRNLRG